MVMTTTIGWTKFALKRHIPGTGLSYRSLLPNHIVLEAMRAWDDRRPGDGETDLSRKVVVTLPSAEGFYCQPTVPFTKDLPLQAQAYQRQEGEDPTIEVFTDIHNAISGGFMPIPAVCAEVVCYEASVLLENGGTRDTECGWEIVCLLCHGEKEDRLSPMTMARNFLKKPGGTFTDYTAQQFAEAIYKNATQRQIKVKGNIIGWVPPTPYFERDRQPESEWFVLYHTLMGMKICAEEIAHYRNVLQDLEAEKVHNEHWKKG